MVLNYVQLHVQYRPSTNLNVVLKIPGTMYYATWHSNRGKEVTFAGFNTQVVIAISLSLSLWELFGYIIITVKYFPRWNIYPLRHLEHILVKSWKLFNYVSFLMFDNIFHMLAISSSRCWTWDLNFSFLSLCSLISWMNK